MSKNGWFGAVAAVVVSVVVLGAGAVGLQKYRESQCDHEYDSGKVTVEATCTEDGKMKYTCEECGKKKVEVIEATGHEEVLVEEVSATCDKPGKTAGKVCSVCEEILEGMKEIPKLGHDMVTVAAKAATCTEDGNTAGLACSRCDYTDVESIPAGHTWNESNTYIVIPTCSKGGVKVYTCEVCNEKKNENVGPNPNYHNWDEGVETESATCETEGVMTYTCNDCGTTKTSAIPATGEACDWAFCGDNGLNNCVDDVESYYQCTVCGSEKTEVSLATGHNMSSWTVREDPSCVTEGYKTRMCMNGLCTYTEQETIPVDPEAHFWDGGVLSEGVTTYTCEGCGATRTETIETPECQHSYYEGFCTKCLSENDETQTVQVGDSVLGKSFRLNSGESITLMGDNGETIVFAAMGSSFVCIVDGDYSTPDNSICSKNSIVIEGPPNDHIVVFHACAGLAIGSKGSTITIDENTTISAVEGDVDWLAREVSAEE